MSAENVIEGPAHSLIEGPAPQDTDKLTLPREAAIIDAGDTEMRNIYNTPKEVIMAKSKDDLQYVPTDEEIEKFNEISIMQKQDPKFWVLDADAWRKTRDILAKLLELCLTKEQELRSLQLKYPAQVQDLTDSYLTAPSAKEIYNIIANNLPWDASHEKFDVSKIWICWHPDKIQAAMQRSRAAGVAIADSEVQEMADLSTQVFSKCRCQFRELFALAEKMRMKGMSFSVGYASDDESDDDTDLDDLEEPSPETFNGTVVQDFHKTIHREMEQWIRVEFRDIVLPENKKTAWSAGQKSEARQQIDRYNAKISEENLKRSLKPILGVVPLELFINRWKRCNPSLNNCEVELELLQLWPQYQFPLGWTHTPPEPGEQRYPTIDEMKAEYKLRLNRDPVSGVALPSKHAGWPAWMEITGRIQNWEMAQGIQPIGHNSKREEDDLQSYLSDAGYGDDEWKQKETEWSDFQSYLRVGGPKVVQNPFETGPEHPRDPSQPSLRSRRVKGTRVLKTDWAGDLEDDTDNTDDDDDDDIKDLVNGTNDLVLYDSNSHLNRVRRLVASQRTSCSQIKQNHTVMGDPIIAFDKRLTVDEDMENGVRFQKYSYQFVVDKGHGIKELLGESECGGRAIHSKLDEGSIPRISEAYHAKTLPRPDVMFAIECGVNWITQPRVPNRSDIKKSPSAVVELFWKAQDASTGVVTEQITTLWRSHLLSMMGSALGNKLCADSLSTGPHQFRSWWEAVQYIYPHIRPPGSAMLTLPAPPQLKDGEKQGKRRPKAHGSAQRQRRPKVETAEPQSHGAGQRKRQPKVETAEPQANNTKKRDRRSANSMNTSLSL